jgi:hypothetical protein
MSNDLVSKLKKLADEGDLLIQSGYEIPASTFSEVSSPVLNWLLKSNSLLSNAYGKNSPILKEFKEAYTIRMSVNLLVTLAAAEMQNNVANELPSKQQESAAEKQANPHVLNILKEQENLVTLSLQQQVSSAHRTDASILYGNLLREISVANPNWQSIVDLVKSGFDYGIPFGTELAILVNKHYYQKKTQGLS